MPDKCKEQPQGILVTLLARKFMKWVENKRTIREGKREILSRDSHVNRGHVNRRLALPQKCNQAATAMPPDVQRWL